MHSLVTKQNFEERLQIMAKTTHSYLCLLSLLQNLPCKLLDRLFFVNLENFAHFRPRGPVSDIM